MTEREEDEKLMAIDMAQMEKAFEQLKSLIHNFSYDFDDITWIRIFLKALEETAYLKPYDKTKKGVM